MQFTDEQSQAIHTLDQNLVVLAGAGSGKTSVLVNRYLHLLEQNPEWPIASIVAITFTEKAAKEMRARVQDAIDKRAETPGTARDQWVNRQGELDSARISTIHSLCAMLLRANAAEAGVDPAFQVMEEADAALLAEEAIELAMIDLASDADTAALFEYWTPTDIRKELREHLETPVIETRTGDELYAAWEQIYLDHLAQLIERLRENTQFLKALEWRSAANPPDTDKLYGFFKAAWEHKEDILFGSAENIFAALSIFSKFRPEWGSQANWGGEAGKIEASQIIDILKKTAAGTLAAWGSFDPATERAAAHYSALWNRAIQHTQEVFREKKQERAFLDFADLERRTRELLNDYPEVSQRYRGKEFNHLLVDEFQDTNAAQRDIVYALSGLKTKGSLFVVGDPKQSIYAFRGAQLEVFYQVRQEIIDSGGREIYLADSFRSHDLMVDAFNTLFARLLPDYQPMRAKRTWDTPEIIEVIAVDKKTREDEDLSAERLREWQAAELAQRLQTMVASETLIYDKEHRVTREVNYGDCAVLFQVIAHMQYVEDAFKRAGIPYVTHAGRGYYNRPEVWDLLNLLKALHNRADNLSLASALRSPLFGMNDDVLYMLRRMPYKSLWDAILAAEFENDVLQFVQHTLPELAEMARRVTLPELLGAILRTTAYTAVLRSQPDGARKVNNVEKLIEMARRNTRLSLGEFLLYLRDLTDRETREGEAAIETRGAVQLMTVHAAKGLEFPVVSLYDCSYDYERVSGLIHVPEFGILCKVGDKTPYIYTNAAKGIIEAERAEKLRRLYVAATRAQDYLILVGALNTRGWDRSWMGQVFEALNLQIDPERIETRFDYGIRLYKPVEPPKVAIVPEPPNGWQLIGVNEYEPLEPPLLAPLPPPPVPPPQTLAASDLGLLGEAYIKPNGLTEFRNYILRNTTTVLRGHSADRVSSAPSKRTIGEIVHSALQWLHTGVDIDQQIRASAWSLGVSNETIVAPVLLEVHEMIQQIRGTSLWQEIMSAEEIYREYPFSFKLGGRIVNGKIDVLFRIGKRWHVVDFKSDSVRPEFVHWHSRRYHMQIGAYAAAVTEALGKAPITRLHYLRPNITITVEQDDWRNAVSEIEEKLQQAMDSKEE